MTRQEFIEVMESTLKRAKELGKNALKETVKYDGNIIRVSYVFPILGNEMYLLVKTDSDKVYVYYPWCTFQFDISEIKTVSRGISRVEFFDKDFNAVATIKWD